MKTILKLGYARRGELSVFCNREAVPDGVSVEDLHLSALVPDGDEPCIVFKPLENGWYLLSGVHRGKEDRGAAVVAARLLNRDAAQELLEEPEKLLRLALFLRDEETAEAVEGYREALPEDEISLEQLPALGPEWDAESASPEQVRLLLTGLLNAGKHDVLQFVDAGPASLHAALEKVPVVFSLRCGFSIPFAGQAGCCTDLNLLPSGGARAMLDARVTGWPNKSRVALSSENKKLSPNLSRALEAIVSMEDHDCWQEAFGNRDEGETVELLAALAAVREAEQAGMPRSVAVDNLVQTFSWQRDTASRRVRELDRLLGPEQTDPPQENRGHRNSVPAAPPLLCPGALELKRLLRQERDKQSARRHFRAVSGIVLLVMALLLVDFDTLGDGVLMLRLQLALNLRSAVFLLLALGLGVCLGRLWPWQLPWSRGDEDAPEE